MDIDLENMSEDELRRLNHEIVKRLELFSFARRKMKLIVTNNP